MFHNKVRMETKIITVCYRKIFDTNSVKEWEKRLFEDSYKEFKMQAQFFNQQKTYETFAQLMHHVSGAEKLHFLVSAAVVNYIKQLNNKIPDVLNNIGKSFLRFNQFNFEIINSHVQNKLLHSVAVSFYSEPLIWHETIGEYLLLSDVAGSEEQTHLYRIQPFINIHSYKLEK